MVVFMYLLYFLTAFSFVGLSLIGLLGFVGQGMFGLSHATIALFVALIFFLTESLMIFFHVGMGATIRDYLRNNPDADHGYIQRSKDIKKRQYPRTLLLLLAGMVTLIMGGGVDQGVVNPHIHGLGWAITMILFVRAMGVQKSCMKDHAFLILEMMGYSPENHTATVDTAASS